MRMDQINSTEYSHYGLFSLYSRQRAAQKRCPTFTHPSKWKDLPIQPYTVTKAPTQLKKLEIVLAVLASLYSSHYPIDTTPPQASLPTTKPLRYRIYPFAIAMHY